MRILHTSDWHLGKRLNGISRLGEQEEVLGEIAEIVERENADITVIAGDVFDTAVPPAEAEELFFRAAKRLAGETRAVVAISGNHDDSVRLCASAPVAAESGIYIAGAGGGAFPTGGERRVRPVRSGNGWSVFANTQTGEEVYLGLLPYPTPELLGTVREEETYQAKVGRLIRERMEACGDGTPALFVSHLFVQGGIKSESERDIELGGAQCVPADLLPGFGYVALGHLHRRQRAGRENALYSGSILQYSFSEAGNQKSVTLLETGENGSFSQREIPLTKGKRLVRLEAGSVAEGAALLRENSGCLAELGLRLAEPLTPAGKEELYSCGNLAHLGVEVAGQGPGSAGEAAALAEAAVSDPGKLFREYYGEKYGAEPPEELMTLFLEVMAEAENGTGGGE